MELDYSGDLIKMLFPFLHEPLACLGSSEPRNIQAEMIGHDSGYHDNQMDVNIFFSFFLICNVIRKVLYSPIAHLLLDLGQCYDLVFPMRKPRFN